VCDDVEGCSDPAACNYVEGNIDPFTSYVGPCLQLDTHKVHTEGDLAGMITYRMYFHAPEEYPDYFVVGLSGSNGLSYGSTWTSDPYYDYDPTHPPLEISTSTSFFQHPLGTHVSSGIQAILFSSFPDLEYDSWVTIGHAPENGPPPQAISSVASPDQDWITAFELGGDILMNDAVGGLWFIVPLNDSLGYADSLGRVLLGQLTTDGVVNASINVQPYEGYATGGFTYPEYFEISSQTCTTSNLCIYPDQNGECNE